MFRAHYLKRINFSGKKFSGNKYLWSNGLYFCHYLHYVTFEVSLTMYDRIKKFSRNLFLRSHDFSNFAKLIFAIEHRFSQN